MVVVAWTLQVGHLPPPLDSAPVLRLSRTWRRSKKPFGSASLWHFVRPSRRCRPNRTPVGGRRVDSAPVARAHQI